MLAVGEIVKGSYWSESVEIKRCELIAETLYIVEAIGRNSHTYYETLLEKDEIERLERLQIHTESAALDTQDFQHYLRYYVLKVDQRYSQSMVRGNKKIMPLPHQIEAVYSRMLQSPQVRFLLADDPGAGKTIMSGMLIRELLARKSAERILILVPPLVLRQWQEELKEKFGEDFFIITRSTLKEANGNNPFEQHAKCLASMYWTARDDVKSYLYEAKFDLIIVDEAHKMAAYTHGKKKRKVQRTKLYQLGEGILRHAEHCVLLTATPHKGDKENFRHLMQLVDHEIFSSLHSDETLREKSNPFVIRRLKENMVNFDGTPLFPKRTTQTIGFELSEEELDLYEQVTDYVRLHFNRAKNNNNNSTAFAMMLLQRRLSSSIDAIHLSLERRRERLEELMKNELKICQVSAPVDEYEEVTVEEQQEIEEAVEGATDALNLDELQIEIDELSRLIEKTSALRALGVEKKYVQLEETLFGENGLLKKGEKILIFTESTDTLQYLERCLLQHVDRIAKITGQYNMDQRREQVKLFASDECQIMLATDAGGESINLQFCNQMINYDIPWNPNRLEQRMGRVHRIGQKNEVFIFNLVARNTREGDVMIRLLDKMEQMRQDLGQELVYDFIGEVLEDQSADLATLMETAVVNREHLDDIIAKMERMISEEHQRLLELAKEERMDETSFDLPGMRRTYHDLVVKSFPLRVFAEFTVDAFSKTRIKLHQSSDNQVTRIDRIPKNMKEYARRKGILLKSESSYRFTSSTQKESEEIELLHNDHPLFNLALSLTEKEIEQTALGRYSVQYPVREKLDIEIHEITIVDGTGRELSRELLHLARREDGTFLMLDPYWLFLNPFEGSLRIANASSPSEFTLQAIKEARARLIAIKAKREEQLNKKIQFLHRSFEAQYETLTKRLETYYAENIDNRNSALINQTTSQMEELEERREERLEEIERERSIQLRPTRKLAEIEVIPVDTGVVRLFPSDYIDVIKAYEYQQGRTNIKAFEAYGLIDFYSESADGEARFILLKDRNHNVLMNWDDLQPIIGQTYIYVVENGHVVEERPIEQFIQF